MELAIVTRKGDIARTSYFTWKNELANLFMKHASDLNDSDTEIASLWEKLYEEEFGESLKINVSLTTTVGELKTWIINDSGLITDDERRELARKEAESENREETEDEGQPLGPYRVDLVELPTLQSLNNLEISLEQAGLQDGDVLGLLVHYVSRRFYSILSTPDLGASFAQIRSSTANPPRATGQIWGAILYTEEDEQLAVYVRKYFTSLNVLSGEILKVYVIEKPDDWDSAKRYWKKHLTKEEFAVYSNMEWLYSAPYDKSQVYEIAETLGVEEDQIPCLVLFDTLARRDKLVFPIPKDVSPAFFRTVFGAVKKAIGDSSKQAFDPSEMYEVPHTSARALLGIEEIESEPHEGEDPSSRAFESVAASYEKILKLLKPVSQAPGSELARYEFYGQTVFLNHPQDVHLSNFQNRSTDRDGGTADG